ncbi:MAG: tRNA (guanosine(37)-N1)-methyltransferase TrmD [Cardiobacteriaceae bacterium]|nr:tRNA (guanosine(37)-N1)-methyltransferase TrmD [Cardiobacteriaceae bacterium]
MRIDFVSIFPELIRNYFQEGVVARAIKEEILDFRYHNPRQESTDKHHRIDDRPFGGGPGMLMQYAPLAKTAEKINAEIFQQNQKPLHIFMSPQGEKFTQTWAKEFAELDNLVLWCGRYEGVDQRFIDKYIDLEISLGDFVLSGGEIAAICVADAVSRLIDGVLGCSDSALEDSFSQANLLDCPHYSRPETLDTSEYGTNLQADIDKIRAPQILLSGDHAKIARWRMKQSLGRTFLLRPDLIAELNLTVEQKSLLAEFLTEHNIYGEKNDQHN